MQMLGQFLKEFDVEPEYDLSIYEGYDVTTNILEKIKRFLKRKNLVLCLCMGINTTTFSYGFGMLLDANIGGTCRYRASRLQYLFSIS